MLPIVAFANEENVFVHVPNTSGSTIDFEDTFWNMFEKELPKYNRLDAIFPQPPFHTININTTFGHFFNNLQNCPINITYVADLKSILALKLRGIGDSS